MATAIEDDDFDQFDKPGSERSRRRRTSDDEWDSELDDLLEEDLLSGKKTQSDFSDEELNDDLLQSDEEDQDQPANFSSDAVTISLNATSGMTASFELSKSTNTASEVELDEADDEVVDEESEEAEAVFSEEYTEGHYEGLDAADLTRDLMEYAVEQEEEEIDTDEVLDLEINEPLDEFPLVIKTEKDIKEESDEEDDDDEESGRLRFKTERKEGNIIRLSEAARERRNIPETLELSNEDKAALMEFEERERQRKQSHYGGKRGGYARRRGAVYSHAMGDQRRVNNEIGKMKAHRPPLAAQPSLGPIRSLFQQQPIKPLLRMPRPRHSSPAQPKTEFARGDNTPPSTLQHPKNIHINPHFKGSVVTPVQTPLLPTPTHPRSAAPQRFSSPPDFHPHTPSHFNQGPRLPPPDQWRSPPSVQEREPFFIGDHHFSNHHLFDQRSPPPPPHLPPHLNSNHPMPNQGPPPFGLPGPGFNLPGQPSGFSVQGQQSGFSSPGHQPGYSAQGQQPGYNQPVQPPRFNQPVQPPLFNQQGQQPGYSQPGPQPGFNQQGQQHSFTQQGQQPIFNQVQPAGFNSSGQSSGFNQHGQQSGFNPHGQQPNYQHGMQSGYSPQGQQPGFNPQGPPHGFSRERSIRPNIQPPSLVHYNHPPRQQFTSGQPFLSHAQANIQTPLQHTMPPPPHQTGPPQPLLPSPSSQFRPHLQSSQTQQSNNRMPRQSPIKPRRSTPSQNVGKRGNPPSLPRNSNLRELPIAQPQVTEITNSRQRSVPAAQVKPIAHSVSAAPGRTAVGARKYLGKMAKTVNPAVHPKIEVKEEQKILDEDEETRLYRLKIEEQKRLREEILKRKEIRRQQQAGARKKELLERLAHQHSPSTQVLNPQEPQTSQIPINSNQTVLQPALPVRHNVRNRVLAQKQETFISVQQKNAHIQQGARTHLQFQAQQGEQRKLLKQMHPNRLAPQNLVQPVQKVMQAPTAQPATVLTSLQTSKVALIQGTPVDRKAGVKRTVMQRSNSASGDGPHIGAKVRVIKLSGAGAEHSAFGYLDGQPQRHPASQQPHQPQQQRQQQIRKVTLTKAVQQQQTQIQPIVTQAVQSIQGLQQPKKVIMRGRGRGAASQMGRGRMMPNKPNLRVVECKPQPCTVSVEGLSSSTTDFQLQSLLMSVGPIESFQMLPEQRKAIAKFTQPEHASSFQQKFHRHMIDLSHINVLLLAE